jgi:putative hydrolase of the HAD superfamily
MLNPDTLRHIDCWIFDLDNTLYHPRVNLFAEIDARMGQYIADLFSISPDEAKTVQKSFFHEHGTTLRGLMDVHGCAPQPFLDYVHDVDMSALLPDPALAAALAALPGRKILFTNADTAYAKRVLDRLGLSDAFDGIHCIFSSDLQPKPRQSAYDSLIDAQKIDARQAIFFEDMSINLVPAKAMGMTTVWVKNESPWSGKALDNHAHVDVIIDDVSHSLSSYIQKVAL